MTCMRRAAMARRSGVVLILTAVASLTACSWSTFPASPETVGADFPEGGIPTAVTWPSDWLDAVIGEPNDGISGEIVDLRLEYHSGAWMWRVTSLDPGRDWLDEMVTEPDRGLESILDATDLSSTQQHHVTLSEDQLADVDVGAYEAARLSGEEYPSPRLVAMELTSVDGLPTWRVTIREQEDGEFSTLEIDAMDGTVRG